MIQIIYLLDHLKVIQMIKPEWSFMRQYRSNQGRSPEEMERKYKGCGMTLILFLIAIVGALIYNMI